MQAFAEGKTIESKQIHYGDWVVTENPVFFNSFIKCRIKPQPTYRPFKNAEECWQEMQKHQPFGWIKMKGESNYSCIVEVLDTNNFHSDFNDYTFADGEPFGVKEKER